MAAQLSQLLPGDLFALLLVFARIGAALMVMPGFGEVYVMPRSRLIFALAFTVVTAPVVAPSLPPLPASPFTLFVLVAGEIVVGLFFGAIARFLMAALHIAGTIIGFQSSLANATMFDPANAQQGSLLGTFLGLVGLMLVFVTDLHHVMILAITDSYGVFAPAQPLPFGDFSDFGARTVAQSFLVAMHMAAPFIAVGLIFYLGLGLVNRLMPQIQVFFIALPLQIVLAFGVLTLTLSATLLLFLTYFQDQITALAGRG